MLILSSADMVQFTWEVQQKFVDIIGKMSRRNKEVLVPDVVLRSCKRMDALVDRYRKGDLRHDEQDVGAMKCIAEWCLAKWDELHGTESGVFVVNSENLDGRKRPRPRNNPFAPVKRTAGGLYLA